MKKLLIVVDMQNDFITGALGSEEAKGVVAKVVNKIQEHIKRDDDIIFTLDTHGVDYLNTLEGQNLPVNHCIKGTTGHELCDEIKDVIVDFKFPFYNKNTFGSKDLVIDLEKNSYEEIELIGLCTDICVISNALLIKAFLPEIDIVVDGSCCAGISPQSHTNALNAMKMCQIKIVNS